MKELRSEVFSLTGGGVEIRWTDAANPTREELEDLSAWFMQTADRIERMLKGKADAANFIDPGCGGIFEDGIERQTPIQCTRPYGHPGVCEGGGFAWGATLEEFEPLPAGSETAKTKAPKPEPLPYAPLADILKAEKDVQLSPWVRDFLEKNPPEDPETAAVVAGILKDEDEKPIEDEQPF